MNLLDLRQGLWDQLDWDASPTTRAVERLDRFLNRAQGQVVLDAPFLTSSTTFLLRTQPDVAPTLATDTVTPLTGDDIPTPGVNPWTFTVDLEYGTTDAVVWNTKRGWDGRYIEIIDANDIPRVMRIRSVWLDVGQQHSYYKFTVDKPWDVATWGGGPFASWRVYHDEYYLPDNTIIVESVMLEGEGEPFPLEVIGEPEAERLGMTEHASDASTGQPFLAFRRREQQLIGLKRPLVAAEGVYADDGPWTGPEPQGSFRYVATVCWGKRDTEVRNQGVASWFSNASDWNDTAGATGQDWEKAGNARFIEPLLESAPSPVSELVTLAPGAQDPSAVIKVQIPNIEWMLGYFMHVESGATTYERANLHHSGLFIRIYRQRVSEILDSNYTSLTYNNPYLHALDYDDAYYLLAEMRIDEINEGIFLDDGSILPDHQRRLRDINGYTSIKFFPHPDAAYRVQVRATCRPPKLISPYDAPGLHSEASDLIIAKALEYHYETMHDGAMVQNSRAKYLELLAQVKRNYGTAIPPNQAVPRKSTRYPNRRTYARWRR